MLPRCIVFPHGEAVQGADPGTIRLSLLYTSSVPVTRFALSSIRPGGARYPRRRRPPPALLHRCCQIDVGMYVCRQVGPERRLSALPLESSLSES